VEDVFYVERKAIRLQIAIKEDHASTVVNKDMLKPTVL
jgi:hypothetical protein